MSQPSARSPQRTLSLVIVLLAVSLSLAAPAEASDLPDLAAHTVGLDGTSRAGDHHHPSVNVTNRGSARAGPVEVQFLIDGASHDVVLLNATIYPGETYRVRSNVPWNATEGHHLVEVLVDPRNAWRESDEANNKARGEFLIARAPPGPFDLAARALEVLTASGARPTLLRGVVGNPGPDWSPFARVDFLIDRSFHSWHEIPPLPPGGSVVMEVDAGPLPPGRHVAVMAIDPEDRLRESDEGNNVALAEFEILAPPEADLSVRIVAIHREPLRTEYGNFVHPHPRRVIEVAACNSGRAAVGAILWLDVEGNPRPGNGWTSGGWDSIATQWLSLESGSCATVRVPWDPVNAIGDVTVRAGIAPPFACDPYACTAPYQDPDWSNNQDQRRDFILVGGLGGAVLPLP